MRKIMKYIIGTVVSVFFMGMISLAAEFSVTEVDAVLYSTPDTVLYADADLDSVVILNAEAFPDDIPVKVTGITSNGFFRVDIGAVYYIYGTGLREATGTTVSTTQNADSVYQRIIAMKAQFPEGMHWTNDNYYGWNAGIYSGGFGCAGFAFLLSDAAFGTESKAFMHNNYNNIKVGDILRINHDSHSVVVLEVKQNSVIVAEGNYNGAIHWGREIPKSQLQGEGNYIMTRY